MSTVIEAPAPIKLSGSVSLDELKQLPYPEALGPRHKPVPHWSIVEALQASLAERQITGYDTRLVLSREGQRLDATFDFAPGAGKQGEEQMRQLRAAVGNHVFVPKELQASAGAVLVMTHANDESRALRMHAAMKVFICTNLAIGYAANGNAKARKHTGDEPWSERIEKQLEQAFDNFVPFTSLITRLQNAELTDDEARALIFQIVDTESAVATVKYSPIGTSKILEVGKTYFAHETPDTETKTRWSLHNAFTRVMRETALWRQVETSSDLLRILSESLPVEPGYGNPN